jgi:hypothetical protein
MPLRNVRTARKIELRDPAPATPPAQPRSKSVFARHEYLPGSCAKLATG